MIVTSKYASAENAVNSGHVTVRASVSEPFDSIDWPATQASETDNKTLNENPTCYLNFEFPFSAFWKSEKFHMARNITTM